MNFRWARCLALGALLALAAAPLAFARTPWPPPADGILANDPTVVWGELPNGVRYAVIPGQTPPGKVSLRLVIEAGSLMESEQQRGLAHFLEHMAFKGSTNLAPGEFVSFLQRAGLAFGADTNARTGFDSTVYQLDLPRNDDALVGEAVGILSEIAGRLTLAEDQITPERGVILSEKRVRDTPGARSFKAMLEFLLPGSRYAEREPIGLEATIRTAPRDQFAAFYRDWYTPERSVVVVAGDVDPAVVAASIHAHFGSLTQPPSAPADPPQEAPKPRGLDALLVSDPGLPATVALNYVLPYDARPDSLAKQGDQLRRLLAGAMLSRRLESLGLQPAAPFSQAGAGAFELAPAALIASLRLTTTPENWRQALTVAEQELRRALEHGFSADELVQELAIFRSDLQTAAAGAGTRESSTLAEQLVGAIGDHDVFTSPATDLALVDQLTRDLKPSDVDQALHELWGGREPQIFVTGPIELAEARAEILATYQASRAVPVAVQADRSVGAFAYSEFGKPSGVVSTEEIADLGTTRVKFANGVVLYVKPTKFAAGEVKVAVRFGTGRIGLPIDQPGLDLLAGGSFVDGGLGRHTVDELHRILASHQVGVDLVVGEAGLNLMGTTTPADLPLQLDLLAAYVTDPAYRPEAEERYRAKIASTYARMAAVPDGLVGGPVAVFVNGGDRRFGRPPEADARSRTMAELRAWIDPMLRNGPMTVIVVGDVETGRAIPEGDRTLGALAPRGVSPAPKAPALSLPSAAEQVRFNHLGPKDQALALVYWPTDGAPDARTDIGLDLLAEIMADRLLHAVREGEGATYSPEVYSRTSLALPNFGYLSAAVDVATADAPHVSQQMQDVAAALRAGTITQDEFDRALQPRLAQARNALQSNDYWLSSVLTGAEQYPRLLGDARNLISDHESQNLASVQALATRYLDPARAVKVLIAPAPEGGPQAATETRVPAP
jgi:zinc protease